MHQEETRTDSAHADMVMHYGRMISRVITDIRVNIARQIIEPEIMTQAERVARRTASFNKSQVDRQFKSVLGVNPLSSERWLEPLVSGFVEKNVSLIKSIPDDYLKKIEQMVRATVEQGVSTQKLTRDVYDQFDVTRSRAHLIARDQVSKYNGKLTELRQKEAGVREYEWSTAKDERVRPKHAAVDGRRFSWSDPPAVGSNGERLHPGQDYQCRCTALPVLDEFIK